MFGNKSNKELAILAIVMSAILANGKIVNAQETSTVEKGDYKVKVTCTGLGCPARVKLNIVEEVAPPPAPPAPTVIVIMPPPPAAPFAPAAKPAPAPVKAPVQMREVYFRLSLLGVMVKTDSSDYSGGPDFFVGPQIGFFYRLSDRFAAGLDMAYLSGVSEYQGKIGLNVAPYAQVRVIGDLYLGITARYMLNACGERVLFQGGTIEGHLEYILKGWAFARVSAGGGLHWRNLFDPSKKEFSPAWDGGFTGSAAIGGHF